GDSGPVLVPGKPKESLLVERIEKGEMPPAKDEALSARQRELIRLWVSARAPLAKAKEPPLQETEATTRLSDEDRRFWSFQPPTRTATPRRTPHGRRPGATAIISPTPSPTTCPLAAS